MSELERIVQKFFNDLAKAESQFFPFIHKMIAVSSFNMAIRQLRGKINSFAHVPVDGVPENEILGKYHDACIVSVIQLGERRLTESQKDALCEAIKRSNNSVKISTLKQASL